MTKTSLDFFPKDKPNRFDPDLYGTPVQTKFNYSEAKGDFGIEFEVEGRGLPDIIEGNYKGISWVWHNEGSLRNGAEYVSSLPIVAADLEPTIGLLFDAFKKHGVRLNNSNRTSTHVHVNINGLRINELCSFAMLYGVFEELLTEWCGQFRSGNHFCLRLMDSHKGVDIWRQAFKSGNFRFSNDYKYLSMNPASINRFGSLEFRALEGSYDGVKVVKWCKVLGHLKALALSAEFESPETIIGRLSEMQGQGFFNYVFENTPIYDELMTIAAERNINIERSVMRGCRIVQPVIYSLDWYECLEEMKKVYVPNPFGSKAKKGKSLFEREIERIAEGMV